MREEEILKKVGELAEQQGMLRENNRIAKAILAANFRPDVMEKLYEIISAYLPHEE